jgi:hypothetical protein
MALTSDAGETFSSWPFPIAQPEFTSGGSSSGKNTLDGLHFTPSDIRHFGLGDSIEVSVADEIAIQCDCFQHPDHIEYRD